MAAAIASLMMEAFYANVMFIDPPLRAQDKWDLSYSDAHLDPPLQCSTEGGLVMNHAYPLIQLRNAVSEI